MGKPYSQELDAFAMTFAWAKGQDVKNLRHFLLRWSGEHAVVVGSGGSFSAAVAVALFRELAHHSPTTAATPLDFLSMLGRLSPRTFLLSAEGKNKDVLSAATAAQNADLTSAALTLTPNNPLLDFAKFGCAIRPFVFEMDWVKDGYLATNSLLATVLLFYKALFSASDFDESLAPIFDQQRLSARRAELASIPALGDARHRGLLLLHSATAKPFAVDLESKLSEAALATVQSTDLRQFAHGRHLQLAINAPGPVILLAASATDLALATATADLFGTERDAQVIHIAGETEQVVAVAGLIDAMFLTEALAQSSPYDPGQPEVPNFGRAIHALDVATLLQPQPMVSRLDAAVKRKSHCAGHRNVASEQELREAATSFVGRLTSASIQAIVCDFDGTLCRTENRFDKIGGDLVAQVSTLIEAGLSFAIATGRGGSLHASLRASFDPSLYPRITVGYYSGSLIATLDRDFVQPAANSAFRELWEWLNKSAFRSVCLPFDDVARGGQFSVRMASAQQCRRLRAAIRVWLDDTGRQSWRVFCSGHSVDVLDGSTSKRLVVEHMARGAQIDSASEILRLGDSGQEDGNDFELLRDGLSLSCDAVSCDLAACWNFGAAGTNQAEVTMSYLRALKPLGGAFQMSPSAFGL